MKRPAFAIAGLLLMLVASEAAAVAPHSPDHILTSSVIRWLSDVGAPGADPPAKSSASVTDNLTGRIWVAFEHRQRSVLQDSLYLYSSIDGGVTWEMYGVVTLGPGLSYRYDEMDLELLHSGTATWIYCVTGINGVGNTHQFCAVYRWNITAGGSADGGLIGFPNTFDNNYYQPRIASNNSIYASTARVFITAVFDSSLGGGNHAMFQRMAVIDAPFAPGIQFDFTRGIAGGTGSWKQDHPEYFSQDIAYYNDGVHDRLYSVMCVNVFGTNDVYLHVYWSDTYGASLSGSFPIYEPNEYFFDARLAFTGGPGNTTGMITYLQRYGNTDRDVYSYYTTSGGLSQQSWVSRPVDISYWDANLRPSLQALPGAPGNFVLAYGDESAGKFCYFNGTAWSVNTFHPGGDHRAVSAAYRLGTGNRGIAVSNADGTRDPAAQALYADLDIAPGENVPAWVGGYQARTFIRLTWMTFSESNNLGFQIERGYGKDSGFTPVPGVFIAGTGTSSEPRTYVFDDSLPPEPTMWYRVKQMSASGLFTYSQSILPSPDSTAAGAETFVFGFAPRWNLLSVPLRMSSYARTSLFPDALSPAYGFNPEAGYVAEDLLRPGSGYWLNHNEGSIIIIGIRTERETVAVSQGWNIIGSISSPLEVASIGSIPAGMVLSSFYGYGGGAYSATTTIEPGKGYWVKASQAGQLVLSTSPVPQLSRIRIVPTSDLPPTPPGGERSLSAGVPTKFALDQNYPNPFNPTTDIRFQITDFGRVRLVVYDLLGRQVATLVDEEKAPGSYTVKFPARGGSASGGDASNLASGTYLYRLTAGGFTATRRMMLVK